MGSSLPHSVLENEPRLGTNHRTSGDFEVEEPGHPFWFLLSEEGTHGLAEVKFGSRTHLKP